HDEIVHWSHMLGVRRDAREMGVGRRLKEYQRAMLASRGIAREFWTFDPLQAKNAHLNINRLGVRVIDYVVDMYGSMGSPLHFGVPTDRLIVECSTGARGRVSPVTGPAAAAVAQTPILTPFMQPGDPGAQGESPGIVRIEVPGDVEFVPPETLSQWRLGTRTHFQWAFLRGYRVVGLMRDPASSRAFYVLARDGHRMDA